MAKFCPGCGSPIIDVNSQFCSKCGNKILPTSLNQQTPVTPVTQSPKTETTGDKLKSAGKWVAICCGGAILCVVVAAFVFGMTSTTPSSSVKPVQTTIASSYNYQLTPVPQITTTTESSVPTEVELSVGQTATTNEKIVTVYTARKTTTYTWSGSSGYQYPVNAKSGNTFIIIDAEIKYLGSESRSTSSSYVSAGDFSMSDQDGNRYDPSVYMGDDGLGYFKELYKNQKVRGKVLFEVPQNVKGLKLYYDFGNVFSGIKLASWTIN